jgi:Tfp pilus assembly protein PilE
MKQKGFMLAELALIAGLLCVIALAAWPSFQDGRTRKNITQSLVRMQTISIALEAYRVDNKRALPALAQN